MELKPLVIKGKKIGTPIFQGGMGVGVSLESLSSSVALEDGAGILSSAGLHVVGLAARTSRKKVSPYQAAYTEVFQAKFAGNGGYVGMNIMYALKRDFSESVKGSLDAGVDAIVCGAGLPLNLPFIQKPGDTALIPIVSSVRALDNICKRWGKKGYRPDAVIVEGPMAGGHLGFDIGDINNSAYRLEKLFSPIKDYAMAHGDFPVIVAGGIYTHEDICFWQCYGADGVQMGTRFLVTKESSASLEYKLAVVNSSKQDIVIADSRIRPPGSPCGLPFRVLRNSPAMLLSKYRKPLCNRGFVLQKDKDEKFTICPAKDDCQNFFCICNSLIASAGCAENELPIWTVGLNAYRVKKILSVHSLVNRLKGIEEDD